MTPRTLIIDADVIRYQLAFANTKHIRWDEAAEESEVVNMEKALLDVEDYINGLCERFKTDDFLLPLSGKENWRKELYPDYKANRKKRPKPALWYAIDECLYRDYSDRIITRDRLEGDDIIGLLVTHPSSRLIQGKPVVVSIDKDMATLPGIRLFNPRRADDGVRFVTTNEANRFWMLQTLMGDTTDNYPGCPGIGPKRAEQALPDAPATQAAAEYLSELWQNVLAVYTSKGHKASDALMQARLARIMRHGDYNHHTHTIHLWSPE